MFRLMSKTGNLRLVEALPQASCHTSAPLPTKESNRAWEPRRRAGGQEGSGGRWLRAPPFGGGVGPAVGQGLLQVSWGEQFSGVCWWQVMENKAPFTASTSCLQTLC